MLVSASSHIMHIFAEDGHRVDPEALTAFDAVFKSAFLAGIAVLCV